METNAIYNKLMKFNFYITMPQVASLLIFCIAITTLLLYGGQGLSDNADFKRIMQPNYITYSNEQNSNYVFNSQYNMILFGDSVFEKLISLFYLDKGSIGYISPHFAVIHAAKVLNFFYNIASGKPLTWFNNNFIAFIYILLYVFAAYLILDYVSNFKLLSYITVALFVLVFCDSGYILYFNSFYGEPLQFVCFLLIIAFFLKILDNPNKILWIILYYIAVFFYSGSKFANIPIGICFSLTGLIFLLIAANKKIKVTLIVGCIISLAFSYGLVKLIPRWMGNVTSYQAVFYGILKGSDNVNDDLLSLGIDTKYSDLANTTAYLNNYSIDIESEQFENEFYNKVGKIDIMKYYLFHMGRFIKKIDVSCKNSAYIRPHTSAH